jgi:hypothetical protein
MNKFNREAEEFDLLGLFLKAVNIIRANFWIIVIFFLLGTGFGLFMYYNSTKIYESKMVISSTILTRSYAKNLVDRINRHKREMNDSVVMNLLQVSKHTSTNIAHLNIENVSPIEEAKEADKFIITAEVMSQNILPELQQGLINYFETNEFVKVRVEQNKEYLKQVIAKTEAEISDMEKFKAKIASGEFFQAAKGNVSFDPTTVNSKILELTKEKITLENNFKLANSVQVIEGFSKYEHPSKPKLAVSLISGSFVGLFFVSMLILFKTIRRLLRMADAQERKQ